MENASKALLMAGGILIGILLLALMVTLFAGASSLSKSYDDAKQADAIQSFNSNFTRYLGKDITIHEVATICNFADIRNNKVCTVGIKMGGQTFPESGKTVEDYIAKDLSEAREKYESNSNEYKNKKIEFVYKLEIVSYDDRYISEIKFSGRTPKITEINIENRRYYNLRIVIIQIVPKVKKCCKKQ